jgi:hypothetical protein
MSGRSAVPRGSMAVDPAGPPELLRRHDAGVTRRDRLTALALGLVVFVVLVAAQRTEGISRDEAYYFKAGEQYFGWFGGLWDNLRARRLGRSFSQADIARYFSYNHEHPPVAKVLFGVSWRIFHQCKCGPRHATIPLLSNTTAHRLPTCALSGLLVGLVFLFGVRLVGRRGATVAAVLTAAMPHPFFHASIATFDQPINVLWFVTAYAYWRSLTSRRWAILAGVALGFALGTKHNAWFLPPLLGIHYLVALARSWRAGRVRPKAWWIPSMAVLGPLVFFLLWPWLWHQTWPRYLEYVRFHLHHVYYNIEYLGRNWNVPPFPWHYPLVVTALTVPVTTLVLALAGAALAGRERLVAWRARRAATATPTAAAAPPEPGTIAAGPTGVARQQEPDRRPLLLPGLFLALLTLFPLALFMTGRTPIFGGMKHFITAMPFLALFAALGFEAAARVAGAWLAARRPRLGRAATVAGVALGVVVCLPAVCETARSHPYGLSHYNLLAGGPSGGASLGMNRQFWGYSPRGLLPWLNRTLEPGARLYPHDMNTDSIIYYKRDGLLRKDIADVWQLEEPGMRQSSWALVIHEKHFNRYDPALWEIYGTLRPVHVLDLEGVPLVTVYHRGHK